MMDREGDRSENMEKGVVTEEGPSEIDKGEACHWEPGKVQWLELMEGETKSPSKIIGTLVNHSHQRHS